MSLCDTRVEKSITDKIKMINLKCNLYSNKECVLECKIKGQSKQKYDIVTKYCPLRNRVSYTCSCPDFQYRNRDCKHVYWFGERYFNKKNPIWWDKHDLLDVWFYETRNQERIGRNDTCPICLDNIDYSKHDVMCCIYACFNSVHQKCWLQYQESSYYSKCVVCRYWMPVHIDGFPIHTDSTFAWHWGE